MTRPGPRTPTPWFAALVATCAVGALAGADGPEIVRVRVPSARMPALFPRRSEFLVLPYDRFEDLARRAEARPRPAPGPRLVRARHVARWDDGQLAGRSELVLDVPPGADAGPVVLDPWSPALVGSGDGADPRATADGRLALRVGPTTPSSPSLDWRLRARLGSDGRAFALALPDLDVSSLVLDLPSGLVPEAGVGARVGPAPGPAPARASWTIESARGRIDLRLRGPAGAEGDAAGAEGCWVEGTIRVDLAASPANWRGEWTVVKPPGAAATLSVDLDPGLELVGVDGPRVASFRAEPAGAATRVAIALAEEGPDVFPLRLTAIARVPAEGRWTVPSARFRPAVWTGERTTVRTDAGRVLESCVERNGRRVPPRPPDPAGPGVLAFESGAPGPVAELVFRRPEPSPVVEVRGLLRLGDDVPRIEAALIWSAGGGATADPSFDLPPGWAMERAIGPDGSDVPWSAGPIEGGGSRVRFPSAPTPDPDRPTVTTVLASAPGMGADGPIDLPRVRPSTPGSRVADEVWAVALGPGLTLRPSGAVGLAWIDPPASGRSAAGPPWAAVDLKAAPAWRWIGDDEARARVDRIWDRPGPRGEIRSVATIAAGRLRVDWTLSVEPGDEPVRTIPIRSDRPVDVPWLWKSVDPAGPLVATRPVDAAGRAEVGFPGAGPAWALELSRPARERVELRARLDLPWDGQGPVPVLSLPDRFRPRGSIAVDVEPTARARVEPIGLAAIDPSGGAAAGQPAGAPMPAGALRRAALLVRRGPEAHLRVAVEPGAPGPEGGVVREATLATQAHPGAWSRHRLTLRIANDAARSFEFTLPPGAELNRARRDGTTVAVKPAGRSMSVALPAPTASRPTSTLTLDYRTGDDPETGTLDPASLLPSCSLPCLSFVWELALPGPWAVGDVGPGLATTERRPDASWPSLWLGLAPSPWRRPGVGPPAEVGEAMLRDLDEAASEMAPGETTLGDWLLRLDAGRRPVVVDRLALAAAGIGPRSRLDLAPEPRAVASTLRTLGLAAVPIGGEVLVTSRAEAAGLAPADPAAVDDWAARARRAATAQSDASDRLQSASRWWGEATPRALSVGEAPERASDAPGWRTWRLVSARWPEPGRSSVALLDSRRAEWIGWLAFAAVFAAGIVACGCPARWRARGLAATLLAASVGVASAWPDPSPPATGLIRGCLAALAWWAGRGLRAPAPSRRADGRPAPGTSRAAAAVAILAIAATPLAAGIVDDAPILAVMPYDGPPGLDAAPDRVAILLADFDRLTRLARPGGPAPPPGPTLASAKHSVVPGADGTAMVESEYDVRLDGPGEAAWPLPIGPGRDLEATVDGRPTPLSIAGNGLSASVSIRGPGSHTLRFRRRVSLASSPSAGESIRVPIARAAFARVAVARGPEARRVEVPEAAGPLFVRDGEAEGALGPVGALEVRWTPGGGASSRFAGPIEMATLWDIRPAGDLARVRFTHDEAGGISAIRLAVEPGVAIRDASIPNLVAVRREGTPARPEWVAHVAPPWPKGVPIEVVAWKPATPGSGERRPPRVEPMGPTRVSGALALRRPADWSGRLEARGGYEPWAEAPFARAWGPFPADDLTLAGAARFDRRPPPPPSVASVPVSSRRSARTTVQVHPRPGRLDASIETRLSDRQGHWFDADATLPEGFRVLRVECDGLTSWKCPSPALLRLRFDGPGAPERLVRIHGSLPARAEGGAAEARSFQAPIPWPEWGGADEEGGVLAVSGPARYPADPDAGVVAFTPAAPEDAGAGRAHYRVGRPRSLAPIRWTSPPARVDVAIDSDLTIFPASVAWAATIRCEISGGPAEALTLTLPTAWARLARLEIPGRSHRLEEAAEGETTRWTVVPDSPFWGRARLVLRADRPLEPGEDFLFPGLAPFAAPGRGAIGRYDLGIANLSGLPLEVAGSPGLREEDAARHRIEETAVPSGAADRAFQVSGERWSLRLKVGQGRPSGRRANDETVAVSQAELACALDADGSVRGRASYDLEPGPAPFLAVRLPEGAGVPWAAVDGRIAPAVRGGTGRWLVPVGDRGARRACLAWRAPPGPFPRAGGAPGVAVALPALEQEEVPTLVSVAAPGSIAPVPGLGGLERIAAPTWDVEEADRLSRRIVDGLADFNRDSPGDREAVVADLIAFELRARALGRAEAASSPAGRASTEARSARLLAARAAIAEATQATGLDGLVEEAQAKVGLAAEGEELFAVAPPDPSDVIRVRRIGELSYFRGFGPSPRRPGGVVWTARATREPRGLAEAGLVLAIGLSASLLAMRLAIGLGRPARRATYGALAAIALALLAWVPLAGGACLVIALLGRAGDRPG